MTFSSRFCFNGTIFCHVFIWQRENRSFNVLHSWTNDRHERMKNKMVLRSTKDVGCWRNGEFMTVQSKECLVVVVMKRKRKETNKETSDKELNLKESDSCSMTRQCEGVISNLQFSNVTCQLSILSLICQHSKRYKVWTTSPTISRSTKQDKQKIVNQQVPLGLLSCQGPRHRNTQTALHLQFF